jgi:uncharacterized membrane protein YbhN (UPF0104 family)
MDAAGMRQALSRVSATTLALAAAAFSGNLFLKAIRWQRLLQAQQIELPGRVSMAAFLSGQFYAQVTLGRVGEFFRVEALMERGVTAGTALASCVFDRLLDVFIVFGLGAVFATRVLANRELAWIALLALLVAAGSLAALLRYAVPAPLGVEPTRFQTALSALETRRFIGRVVHSLRELLQGMLPMLKPRVRSRGSGTSKRCSSSRTAFRSRSPACC